MASQEEVFKKLVAHCKEYGFVFPSSEIYDGLGAVYDYGQMGVELKNNIKKYWWDSMVLLHENIVGIDSAIFMHPTIWKASGHVDAFNDPLIDNKDSKKRYRADVLIEDCIAKMDEKIEKEVEKAAKRFGDSFDEKLFRETKKVVTDVTLLAEINLSFAYYATVFTYDYGYMYEDFYDTTAKAFIAAMNEAERNPNFARKHEKRFRDIYEMANWMAWGFGEVVVEEFARVDWDNI